MGIMSVITFPFKIIWKGAKKGKEMVTGEEEPRVPITAIAQTDYPSVVEYYYEEMGHPTSRVKNFVIIWEKWTTEKNRAEVLKKLGGIT